MSCGKPLPLACSVHRHLPNIRKKLGPWKDSLSICGVNEAGELQGRHVTGDSSGCSKQLRSRIPSSLTFSKSLLLCLSHWFVDLSPHVEWIKNTHSALAVQEKLQCSGKRTLDFGTPCGCHCPIRKEALLHHLRHPPSLRFKVLHNKRWSGGSSARSQTVT